MVEICEEISNNFLIRNWCIKPDFSEEYQKDADQRHAQCIP